MEPQTSHFPIWDQRFRYAPSGNCYSSKIENLAGQAAFQGHQAEEYQGRWHTVFAPTQPQPTNPSLTVEIGCNGGQYLLEKARHYPDRFFIGLDYKFKQIYFAAEKALTRKITNIHFARVNAERLHFIFGENEISEILFFFPDPWAKKSQLKNRLFREEWLLRVLPCLKKGGLFHIKTDHAGYFAWMQEVLALPTVAAHIEIETTTDNLYRDHPDAAKLRVPEITVFESVFIREGKPIHELQFRRK